MNFQTLPSIGTSQHYLDVAFRAAKIAASGLKTKSKSDISKLRRREVVKLDVIEQKLCGSMNNIINKYPNYDELNDFYKQLFDYMIDVPAYRSALSRMKFAENKVRTFGNKYQGMMKSSDNAELIQKLSREFYGRVSSVFDRFDKHFDLLERYRKILKSMPAVKEDCVNVALFGFPNVGKSTILSKLTSARPKIAEYAFTTQKINIGYKKIRSVPIQIFDTPGTLNRFEKMNEIEKIAYLVVNELADFVICVYDPTESYPLSDQIALQELVKKPKVCLVTKTDIVPEEVVIRYKEELGCVEFSALDSVFQKLVDDYERKILER